MSPFACPNALVLSVLTVGRVGAGTGCEYLIEQVAAGRDDFAELSPVHLLRISASNTDPEHQSVRSSRDPKTCSSAYQEADRE